MGIWAEYDPRSGVVYDEIDDAINAALGASGGGAPPPPQAGPPAANAQKPAGVEVSPGRIVSPNGLTTYMYSPTSGWTPSTFPPSADDKRAAGIGTGTTGSKTGTGSTFTPFPTSTERRASEQAQQGLSKDLPPGAIGIAPTRAIAPDRLTIMTKDTTGNWINSGFPPNAADKAAAMRMATEQQRTGGTLPTTPPLTTPSLTPAPAASTLTPEARPFAGLGNLGLGTTLNTTGGPVVPTVGGLNAELFRQPGIGIPSEGRNYIGGIQNDLNTLNTGRQGSLSQIPITPGFRGSGDVGNSISFASGASGGGRAEPAGVFGPTSVSVPDSYVRGQGNAGDANRAYQVGFNIGPTGAGLMNVGGNNVQVNSADKGTGYGFALNAMPSSNVGGATSRSLSADPASQAAQILMLNAALNQPGGMAALTAVNPNQYGGFHAGTGNNPFSGNGGMGQATFFQDERDRLAAEAMGIGAGFGPDGPQYAARGGSFDFRPLGTPATKSLVTTGPMGLVDLATGQVKVVVGEDNADRDRLPDRERVTLTPNSMHVTPLDPPRMMAGGGQQMFQQRQQQEEPTGGIHWPGLYESLAALWGMQHPGPPYYMAEGGTVNIDPGGIPVDSRTGVVPRVTSSAANYPVDWTPPPPAPPPSTLPPLAPPAPPTYTGDPALDPAILQPWQRAQQGLAQQQHLRDVVDEPRRRAAGFVANSATGIPVQQGEIPTGQLGPGMFYDLTPQVNRNINQILGAQQDIRAYGPAQDTTPMFEQLSKYGIQLDAADRLRSMQLQKAGLEATNEIEKRQAALEYTNSANTLAATQNAYTDAQNAWYISGQSPEILQRVLDLQAKLANIQQAQQDALTRSTSDSPALVALRAQEAALQAQLGEGFNEASVETQRALLNKQISDQQARTQKVTEVGNLSTIGVPKLNASILPVKVA